MAGCYCAGSSEEESCTDSYQEISLFSSKTSYQLGECPGASWTFALEASNTSSHDQSLEIESATMTLWNSNQQLQGTINIPPADITLTLNDASFDGVVPSGRSLLLIGQAQFGNGLSCEGKCERHIQLTMRVEDEEIMLVSDPEIGDWNHTNCSGLAD
jgi:hypothetical protein